MKQLFLIVGLASGLLSAPHKVAPSVASSELRRRVAAGWLTDLRWPNFLSDRAVITRFYTVRHFSPAWVQSGVPTSQALTLIQELEGAASKGLNPEDYDAGRWNARLERLRAQDTSPSDVASLDLALTVSLLRLASDLKFGRTNPETFHFGSRTRADRSELGERTLSQLASSSNVDNALENLEPPFAEYRRTQQALVAYRNLASEGENEPLTFGPGLLKPGDLCPAVARLAEFLQRLGDLSGSPAIDDLTYAGPLVEAVKHFQGRHGLEPDGIIGPLTLHALNVPLAERVRQMEFAIERWRWLPRAFPYPAIIINIPEFELRALDASGRVALRMKVIVGQANGHQTPVFSAVMTHLIFSPYWDVPDSIVSDELLPKVAEDPQYLASHDYELVPLGLGGFRIRQAPGPDNALGGVKFLLPNEYSIYLHATPAVTLFSKSRRDFSHGCIRVEKPEELAQWALRSTAGWDREHIREAMTGEQPLRVNLSSPIPVFVVYQTVVVEEDGEVRFFNDIYGHDASLEEVLAAGRLKWM